MKKITLVLSTLLLSIGFAMWPVCALAVEAVAVGSQQLPSLAPMLEKVIPSVVNINVEGSTHVNNRQFLGNNSPFCQQGSPFQGSPICEGEQQIKKRFRGLGSGVVIDAAKGYVVTNNHVVDNASKIQVQLSDGREFDGHVIGKDPQSDVALIQLKEFKNLTAIKMADSDQLRVGDYTVAIGNPYGLGETATLGIVSALGRSGLNSDNYENFIQTDAAINRGSSGGPLVNLSGELIGINTAILAAHGGNVGICFAIPSNMVKSLTAQMVEFGQVKRSALGIVGAELNADLAKTMKVNAQRGVFISQVSPKSAADKAGIKAGDVIVAMDNKLITSFATFRAKISTLPVDSKVTLGLLRDGKSLEVNVTLEQNTSISSPTDASGIYSGIEGAELSDTVLGSRKGVKVDKVRAGSTAERIGLKKGDVIISVNQQPVQSVEELHKIFATKPSLLALHISRSGGEIYLLI